MCVQSKQQTFKVLKKQSNKVEVAIKVLVLILIEFQLEKTVRVFELMAGEQERQNIIVKLQIDGYWKDQTQESTLWETYNCGGKFIRVCKLYNLNGTECAHMSSRKQKAEAHSRSKMHQKVGKNMVTIAEVLKKTDMYERENNEAFQRRQFKKGKIVHYIEQFRKCKKWEFFSCGNALYGIPRGYFFTSHSFFWWICIWSRKR